MTVMKRDHAIEVLERVLSRDWKRDPWDCSDQSLLAYHEGRRSVLAEIEMALRHERVERDRERLEDDARRTEHYTSSLTVTASEIDADADNMAGRADYAYILALDVEHRRIVAQTVGWIGWSRANTRGGT